MIERLFRNFIVWFFWVGMTVVFLNVNLVMFICNYLSLQMVLDRLGFESWPLALDALLGSILESFFPEATFASLFALVVATVMSLGAFLVFNFAFHLRDLIQDRHVYLNRGDSQSAKIATGLIWEAVVSFVILAAALTVVLIWEMALFRYRAIAGLSETEIFPVEPLTQERWPQLQAALSLWAWRGMSLGPLVSLAMTVLCSLGLELVGHRARDRWSPLHNAIKDCFHVPLGDHKPLAGRSEGMDMHSHTTRPADVESESEAEPVDAPRDFAPRQGSLFDLSPIDAVPAKAPLSSTSVENKPGPDPFSADENLMEVVGATGQRVSLATAKANPTEYYLDLETKTVFRMDYWQRLHSAVEPEV